MNFGIPKEVRLMESRVGLTPAAVDSLVKAGHKVFFERGAGFFARFSDEEYKSAGAQIVYSPKEVYGRSEVIVKIGRPTEDEYAYLQSGQILFGFLHLAVASPDLLNTLQGKNITAFAYECMDSGNNDHIILQMMSEVAGRMAPVIAGELLDTFRDGRGILLSGVPGTPPAAVVVVGTGVLGINATRAFHNMGTQVTVLDRDLNALHRIDNLFSGKVASLFANPHNIAKAVSFADVLVCTASVPGGKAPILVTREMVRNMQNRAVVIDFAINSGGNVETSRPTTLASPFYLEEDVIHYCVPNVPARVARSASYAHSNAILPYLKKMGNLGARDIVDECSELRRGVNVFHGKLVHPNVAAALGKKVEEF